MEKAVGILDEMNLAGISPNEHTYTTIMNGYASLGDTGKAFHYFTKLKNEGLDIDVQTYAALLKACCKSGRMQSALAVTKEMNAREIPRNTFVYNILIDGWEYLLATVLDLFCSLSPCNFISFFNLNRISLPLLNIFHMHLPLLDIIVFLLQCLYNLLHLSNL